ncbi:Prp18-domain-containing protein [Fomitiporia mediterranea MF3/22]|uniref:Prp18-domain-containing protein n=1 Tax=Fomitiporia mediterranea (strain MF3/22) TaxID=694068 RepID=UPI0004407B45|nr:Prp18-domain-containing protein [Fomitiporia mediterranea MF3/22]EJD06495.1 Prp18-domain-containing protein [Fomitiporia mediterranea MF3/22]
MRRGELEKLKAEQERREKEEKEKQRHKQEQEEREAKEAKEKLKAARAFSNSPMPPESSGSARESALGSPAPETGGFNISNEDAIRRLRAKGQPIRLFGETDRERRLRLRALELIEEKGHDRHGGQNDFKKALEDVETNELEAKAKGKEREKDPKNKDDADTSGTVIIDPDLIKTDPDKLYPLIYYALKKTLREWGEAMDERPEHIKRSTQGKLAAATQVQSAQYLKPLFKSLRSRNLPADVLARIAEIVYYMQKRQYQRANDSYLRLSIGNAPWPIGVTMVGIHERSAREKIATDQVAHVLNDEVSRKYIQSLKRLLTFSQTKYPPDDLTQLMG